jgi:hypothetical protein
MLPLVFYLPIFIVFQQLASYIRCGFTCSFSDLQGLFCRKSTRWHYRCSIICDFSCIPSSIMIMVLLLFLHIYHITHLHASSVRKYSFVDAKKEILLVLPSEYCGYFPQLCFLFLMNCHMFFKIFRIRLSLTRIPFPSRSITPSKKLILQHELAYESQTSCMDLVK